MARNQVQFQKGMSEGEFDRLYGSEERCWSSLVAWRWPKGFECPRCGGSSYCIVGPRKLFQCAGCHTQTSVTAGTIFDSTKLPLRTWFRAMYHLTQTKGGISSLELARRLGTTQTTAWKVSHKLMQVMLERDSEQPLCGRVEMDDAYLGGKRRGGKRGRGAGGKTPFVAAVQTTPEGQPERMKLCKVQGFRKTEVVRISRKALAAGSQVVSDGLYCFTGVEEAGCQHDAQHTSGNRNLQNGVFKWVNTVLGNVKCALLGTYRAIRAKHVSRYLASYAYRFNRRFNLSSMLTRLAWIALRTPPMPYKLLRLAEDCA